MGRGTPQPAPKGTNTHILAKLAKTGKMLIILIMLSQVLQESAWSPGKMLIMLVMLIPVNGEIVL